MLRGDSGVDYLYGGGGNDTLEGGGDADRLYGGHGDDTLRGGAGGDRLYGQVGNDNLYGESGNDFLYGHGGNDGLAGGTGTDTVRGYEGADRFLVITNAAGQPVSDTIVDLFTAEDAKVNFVNGVTNDVLLGSNIGLSRAYAKSWSDGEIEQVDHALESLVDMSNHTELLKKSNGAEVTFVRQGTVRSINADGSLGPINRTVGGWNGGGPIAIVNNRFNDGENEVVRTVFHELGHNWDDATENAFVPLFRNVGDWTQFSSNPGSQWEKARDAGWNTWYFRNRDSNLDGFARSYGKMNPLEDYATSFAAYMMAETGRDYFGESPASVQARMTGRFNVFDRFFAVYGA